MGVTKITPLDDILGSFMDTSIPYYEDLSRISNSLLGSFIISPAYFSRVMAGTAVKLEGRFLSKGTMIHNYLLERNTFKSNYRVSDVPEPSSANQKEFTRLYVDAIKGSVEHSEAVLSAYQGAYSTKGKSEDKMRSEGLRISEELSEYITEIQSTDDREKIGFNDLTELRTIESNISAHVLANNLIYPTEQWECLSEFHINWIDEHTGLACKSLIDRVLVDVASETIQLVDLKTTRKINNFEESALEYGYYRQLAFYWKALHWYFKNVRNIDISSWTKKSYIVAVSTDEMTKHEVRVFEVEPSTLSVYDELIEELLEEIKWHMQHNQFDHSKDYYENGGKDSIANKWNTLELRLTA